MSSEYGAWDPERASEDGAPPVPAALPRSARAWSRVYNDCVDGVGGGGRTSLDGSGRGSGRGSGEGVGGDGAAAPVPAGPSQRKLASSLRPTSSESAIGGEVRQSTVDFQRSLRQQEAESLRRVLLAAEQAWG